MKRLFKTAGEARQRVPLSGPANLLLFHNALERMLVLAGKIHHLRHFGFSDFVGEDPALPDTIVVDVQHDSGRILARLVEEAFEHVNHELHGRVVIIEEEDAIQVRTFGPGLGFRDDRGSGAIVVLTARRTRSSARLGKPLRKNECARCRSPHEYRSIPEPNPVPPRRTAAAAPRLRSKTNL